MSMKTDDLTCANVMLSTASLQYLYACMGKPSLEAV